MHQSNTMKIAGKHIEVDWTPMTKASITKEYREAGCSEEALAEAIAMMTAEEARWGRVFE